MSDALSASYCMATDSSKWDIGMFLHLCKSEKFNPKEVTFKNADEMLAAITQVVRVVRSADFVYFHVIPSAFIYIHLYRSSRVNLLASGT